MPELEERCPTCAQRVRTVGGEEGTFHYVAVDAAEVERLLEENTRAWASANQLATTVAEHHAALMSIAGKRQPSGTFCQAVAREALRDDA